MHNCYTVSYIWSCCRYSRWILLYGWDHNIEAMYMFYATTVKMVGPTYFRAPNVVDTYRLTIQGATIGFFGNHGSINCMHREWKNCPFGWQGMCNVMLEAVVDHDPWIWQFFGMSWSYNDINMPQPSPVFARLPKGKTLENNPEINGCQYTIWYYLTDGIYPHWSPFVKTIPNPTGNKNLTWVQNKRVVGSMWSGHLVCSKLIFYYSLPHSNM